VEPTNLLKTLAEQDTNFEAYLKLAQHQDHPNETESQVSHAIDILG
jgi:L-lysine 2,3-aminomutase